MDQLRDMLWSLSPDRHWKHVSSPEFTPAPDAKPNVLPQHYAPLLTRIWNDFLDARVVQKNYDVGLWVDLWDREFAFAVARAVDTWPGKWEGHVVHDWTVRNPQHERVWVSVVNVDRRDYVPPRWGSKEWKEEKARQRRLRWPPPPPAGLGGADGPVQGGAPGT